MACDIAIVGVSCRFPEAPNPKALWDNCLNRKVCFQELTDQRWDHSSYFDENLRAKNKTHTQAAALLTDVDRFDARYFRIAPRRARAMDPQHRLCLELGREALQDAGFQRRAFDRESSAVFLGASVSEFATISGLRIRSQQLAAGQFGEQAPDGIADDLEYVNAYTMAGCLINMSAASVAQFFGLKGPALCVDAACSSALSAVIQGVDYLSSLPGGGNSSPVALVGGVYLMLNPENSVCFAKLGALAQKECRPFDTRSSGFILGEGAGMFVLKRLEDSLRDGDRVYAVIKGTAWNNDGGSSTPMTPSKEGQVRMLRQGFQATGWAPEDVGYLECHATATSAGDKTELSALSEFWTGKRRPFLGSVKANIGHTLSAAGAAGLMRAVFALHHRVIPPQAGWSEWNSELGEQEKNFRIPTEPQAWEGPYRATVSAFGFGGTNCLILLEGGSEAASVSPSEEEVLLGFFAPNATLLEGYLRDCEPTLAEHGPGPVSRVLRTRETAEFGAFFRACNKRDALGLIREIRRQLLQGGEWSHEQFLVGPIEQLQEIDGGAWREAGEWCRGEHSFGTLEDTPHLPPSPLKCQSFWPCSSLPGPRAGERVGTLEPPAEVCRVSVESHPYLQDHRLKGKPFLPLAAALDYIISAQGWTPPYSLHRFEVERGVLIRNGRWSDLKVVREGTRVQLRELRKSGREVVAFAGQEGPPPNGRMEKLTTPQGQAPFTVEEFYKTHTFHGPSLRGILSISGMNEETLEGEVATSRPGHWSVSEAREQWNLDPLVVDSAFQLAVFWARSEGKRGLLPRSVESVKVWAPFPFGRVTVQVNRVSEDENGMVGNFLFLNDGLVCAALLGVRASYYDY